MNNVGAGLLLAVGLYLMFTSGIQAATLVVDSRCNIFGAGHGAPNNTPAPSRGGGGIPPVLFTFPAGPAQVLTFSNVTGTINVNFGGDASPDGIGPDSGPGILFGPWNGISAISSPRYGCFLGVFCSDRVPTDPAPDYIDFQTLGINFTALEPKIGQIFFIGDGKTSGGQPQQFLVPTNASRLYLGIPDSVGGPPGWYDDNTGSVTATFEIATQHPTVSVRVIRVSEVELCWDTATNVWYQLQYSSTPTTNQWAPLIVWIPGDGQGFRTNDTVLPVQPQRFYRVAVANSPPQP